MSDTERWRVVSADGTVREVVVALYPRAEGPRWSVVDAVCGPLQRELTPREAVVVWCATHAYRSVVEIRGPGELTAAELVAEERSRWIAAVDATRENARPNSRAHTMGGSYELGRMDGALGVKDRAEKNR